MFTVSFWNELTLLDLHISTLTTNKKKSLDSATQGKGNNLISVSPIQCQMKLSLSKLKFQVENAGHNLSG